MFYILVSRIPFIYNVDNKKEKLFRTFLIGSICYIIIHGLLYSKKFLNNTFVQNYKKYLLYLAGIDFVLMSGIVYVIDKKLPDDNMYIENADDDISIEEPNEEEPNKEEPNKEEPKMTREQILKNYYKMQMMEQSTNKQSPFINKSDAEELKKKDTSELKSDEKSSKSSQKSEHKLEKTSLNKNKEQVLDKIEEIVSDTDLPLYQALD
jgi:hypothetical protein